MVNIHNIKFTTLVTLSVQFSSVQYIPIVLQPNSRILFILQNKTLYPLNNSYPLPLPGNHHCAFCPYEFVYFRYLTQVESYSICLFVTPVVTSDISIVQYGNQEVTIGTMCVYSSVPFHHIWRCL